MAHSFLWRAMAVSKILAQGWARGQKFGYRYCLAPGIFHLSLSATEIVDDVCTTAANSLNEPFD
jgi:hypothetical protein